MKDKNKHSGTVFYIFLSEYICVWDWYYQSSIATQKCFSKTLSIFFMKDCLLIHLADPSL